MFHKGSVVPSCDRSPLLDGPERTQRNDDDDGDGDGDGSFASAEQGHLIAAAGATTELTEGRGSH